MTEHANTKREDLAQADFLFPRTRRHLIEYAIHTRDARATTMGTPEHNALIEAMRENFPEVYDWDRRHPANGAQIGDQAVGSMQP